MHARAIKNISVPLFFIVLGCGDDIIYPPDGQFGNDTGIGDTGFVEYDLGPGLLEPGECLTNEKTGSAGTAYGYQYQCEGHAVGILTYGFDGELYQHTIPSELDELEFGDGVEDDWYWNPQVMACCGEYNTSLEFDEQIHFALNCIMDVREQMCFSAVHALFKEYNTLAPSSPRRDAIWELAHYIQAHYTECIAGLRGNTFPTPFAPQGHTGTWAPAETWETEDLLGFDFWYSTYINGVNWPEFNHPSLMETCTSLDLNDGNVFEDASSPLTYTVSALLDEAGGSVLGPVYEGGRITASADFTSASTSCTGPWCSHASFSEDSAGNWSIDEVSLFADGWFVVENGIISETIDFGYVELSGSAPGTWEDVRGQRFYEVAAGNAHFVVGGRSGENATSLTAYNSTTIAAIQWAGEWYFGPFDVQYVDPTFGTFTLTVSESIWLEE